jgi:hypothetical protein
MINDISQRSGMGSLVKTIGAVTTLAGLAVVGFKSRDEIGKWIESSYDRKEITTEFTRLHVDTSVARMMELHEATQILYGLIARSLPELAQEGQELRANIAAFHEESVKGPVPPEIVIAERDLSVWQASLNNVSEVDTVKSSPGLMEALLESDLTESLGAIVNRVEMAEYHEVVGRLILRTMGRAELREHCDRLWKVHLELKPPEIMAAIVYIKALRAHEENASSYSTLSSYLGCMYTALGDSQAAEIEYLRATSSHSTTP